MPIVNPGGMARATRANPNGVDLMRNAPVQASEPVPFGVSGQRRSARLPWYRGAAGAPMEAENLAVCRVVEEEFLTREFSIVVDCHSGFGTRDRVWFPYAHTARPIPHLAEVFAFNQILDQTHPPRERRHWGSFAQTFGDVVPAARVIALDLPGNGALYRELSPLNVADMALHCRRDLPPAGDVARRSHRHRVGRPPPTGAGGCPAHQRQHAPQPAAAAPAPALTTLITEWAAWQRECPVSRANALRQVWAAARWRAPRARPAVALLLLTSSADALVDTRCSQQLARHWACPLAVHPWAGHDLPLDDAPWVAAQVGAWLAGQPQRDAALIHT